MSGGKPSKIFRAAPGLSLGKDSQACSARNFQVCFSQAKGSRHWFDGKAVFKRQTKKVVQALT